MTPEQAVKTRWPVCGRCSHPGHLHSKDGRPAPCAAKGCHGGPDNEPCPGFITEHDWKAANMGTGQDPRMASEAMQQKAAELRARIEAEMTEERRAMVVRSIAVAASLIAVVVIIRAVRRRGAED